MSHVQIKDSKFGSNEPYNSVSFFESGNYFKTVFNGSDSALTKGVANVFNAYSTNASGAGTTASSPRSLYFSVGAIISFEVVNISGYEKLIYDCEIKFGVGDHAGLVNTWVGINQGRKLDSRNLESECYLNKASPESAPHTLDFIFSTTKSANNDNGFRVQYIPPR